MNNKQIAEKLLRLSKEITSTYDQRQMAKWMTVVLRKIDNVEKEINFTKHFTKRLSKAIDPSKALEDLWDSRKAIENAIEKLKGIWANIQASIVYAEREDE